MLECVPEAVSAVISRRLTIPTIGIGSGAGTDGQVLVLHDLLDMHGAETFQPKFVKHFARRRRGDARGRERVCRRGARAELPRPEHAYPIAPEELSAFTTAVEAGSADDNILADW